MTALDFIQLESATDQRVALKPIIYEFAKNGHTGVPDWPKLSRQTRKLVLKNGVGQMQLEDVSLDAAIEIGMSE